MSVEKQREWSGGTVMKWNFWGKTKRASANSIGTAQVVPLLIWSVRHESIQFDVA